MSFLRFVPSTLLTCNLQRAGGPRRRRGARKNERPAKSAADLDAEMEVCVHQQLKDGAHNQLI